MYFLLSYFIRDHDFSGFAILHNLLIPLGCSDKTSVWTMCNVHCHEKDTFNTIKHQLSLYPKGPHNEKITFPASKYYSYINVCLALRVLCIILSLSLLHIYIYIYIHTHTHSLYWSCTRSVMRHSVRISPVSWDYRMHWAHLCRGMRPLLQWVSWLWH